MKGEDLRIILEFPPDFVKGEETQHVWWVLFAGFAYPKNINPDFSHHFCDFNGIGLSIV